MDFCESRPGSAENLNLRDQPVFRKYTGDYPLFYFSNRLNVVGHDAPIAWPADVKLLDFELEIGACIGRTAKDVSRDEAEECIFGYTIFNDVSARDIQSRQMPGGMGPCKAKSYDSCNVLGPWIVTRDELPSPYGKLARVRVNGEVWAERPITGVVYEFSDMISFASKGETLFPGEVFGSGTVSGCCGLEIDRWINKGDIVELEVEGIGTLRIGMVDFQSYDYVRVRVRLWQQEGSSRERDGDERQTGPPVVDWLTLKGRNQDFPPRTCISRSRSVALIAFA